MRRSRSRRRRPLGRRHPPASSRPRSCCRSLRPRRATRQKGRPRTPSERGVLQARDAIAPRTRRIPRLHDLSFALLHIPPVSRGPVAPRSWAARRQPGRPAARCGRPTRVGSGGQLARAVLPSGDRTRSKLVSQDPRPILPRIDCRRIGRAWTGVATLYVVGDECGRLELKPIVRIADIFLLIIRPANPPVPVPADARIEISELSQFGIRELSNTLVPGCARIRHARQGNLLRRRHGTERAEHRDAIGHVGALRLRRRAWIARGERHDDRHGIRRARRSHPFTVSA